MDIIAPELMNVSQDMKCLHEVCSTTALPFSDYLNYCHVVK